MFLDLVKTYPLLTQFSLAKLAFLKNTLGLVWPYFPILNAHGILKTFDIKVILFLLFKYFFLLLLILLKV